MSKKKFISYTLFVVLLGVVISVVIIGQILRPKRGLLIIESEPSAVVYLDSETVGLSPVEVERDKGRTRLRLLPEEGSPLLPYETEVDVEPGVTTIVRRKLGRVREESSGSIISFERTGGRAASVSVVSIPDGAHLELDGEFELSPAKFSDLQQGLYGLRVSAPGYSEASFDLNVEGGFGLTAIVELSRESSEIPELGNSDATPFPSLPESVRLVENPLGFLRARENPRIDEPEVAKVYPNRDYRVEDIDVETGWYRIRLENGKVGWVSNALVEPVY